MASNGEGTPEGMTEMPISVENAPGGVAEMPTNGEKTPVGMIEMPANGEKAPGGMAEMPTNGERKLGGMAEMPTNGERKLGCMAEMPTNGENIPVGTKEIPANGDEATNVEAIASEKAVRGENSTTNKVTICKIGTLGMATNSGQVNRETDNSKSTKSCQKPPLEKETTEMELYRERLANNEGISCFPGEMGGLTCLPRVILDKIFAYLPCDDLLNVENSCGFFCHILRQSDYNWRDKRAMIFNPHSHHVGNINRYCGLTRLEIRTLDDARFSRSILLFGKFCPLLIHLKLSDCFLPLVILLEMSHLLPRLQRLLLDNVFFTEGRKVEVRGRFTTLQYFSHKNPRCPYGDTVKLFGKCCNLKHLKLTEVLEFKLERDVSSLFRKFPKLLILQVDSASMDTLNIGSHFPKLQKLVLVRVTNIEFSSLAELQVKCESLAVVTLIRCNTRELKSRKDEFSLFSFKLNLVDCAGHIGEGPLMDFSCY